MTIIQPEAPQSPTQRFQFDYDAWRAEDAMRRATFTEHLVGLKANLFDLLEEHGIVLVTVDFDGSGDSGQIENIIACDKHGVVDLPDAGPPNPASDPEPQIGGDKTEPIADVIETLAYDLLESAQGGWEINDGAFGEFRFDVADRTITLGCNTRMSSSDYSETSW